MSTKQSNIDEAWWPFPRKRITNDQARQYIDEWDDDPLSAVLLIWHAGDVVTDNPLLKRHVDDNRKPVMVTLLTRLRDAGESDDMSASSLLKRLRDIEIDWPELDIIDRSIRADRRDVDESDDWITPIHGQVIRHAEIELLHDVPDGNYWTIGRVIQNLKASAVPTEMIVRLLTKHKQDIVEMQSMLLADEMVGVQAGLSNMVALLSIGIDWPELRRFIEENKTSIMRTTLWDIAHSNEDMYQNDGMPILYGDLVKIGVNWPEMAVIKRSVNASKQR